MADITRPSKFGPRVCSAVFQKVLYVLFARPSGVIYRLYSYNCAADAWEDSGVRLREDHKRIIASCDLVVGNNSLFLMSQRLLDHNLLYRRPCPSRLRENTRTPWPLDISDILLEDQVCKTVVQVTEAEVHQNLDAVDRDDSYNFKIRAYGFDKSIFLMSMKVHGSTGKYMLYNVVTSLWECLPPTLAEHLHNVNAAHNWRGGSQPLDKKDKVISHY